MNRYDSPAQDRYFNTYVDLPYEALMGTVAARQAQLDKAQEALMKVQDDTQNLDYIPGYKDEEYVRNYTKNVNNLVDKYILQDMSDPVVKGQLRSEFNRMTNKQDLQNIHASKLAWDMSNKIKAQQMAEGTYDPILDEDPAKEWDTVGTGKVYNYVNSPYKNPRPIAKTFFNDIKPSYINDDGTRWYQGITMDKIKEVVNNRWGDFSDTSEGKQYIKKIAKERNLDYKDPIIRKQIANEYLLDVGKEYTFTEMGGFLPEGMRRSSGRNGEIEMPSTPLRNLYGAKVEQFENVKEVDDAIDKYMSSDKPSDQAKGYDLQLNKESAAVMPPELSKERSNLISSMRNELLQTGSFSSTKDLQSLDNVINAYIEARGNIGKIKGKKRDALYKLSDEEMKALDQLNTSIDANKIKNFIKDSPTTLVNIFRSIQNAPETMTAALVKIHDPIKYRNHTIKEMADSFGTKKSKSNYSEKDNAYDIISKYSSKLNEFYDKANEKINSNILTKTGSIDSKAYSFGFPYYESNNLSQTIDPVTSKKLGVFDLAFISSDLLSSSNNYKIIAVDNKSWEDVGDKEIEEIKSKINTKGLEDIKIDVLPDSKYEYAPVVELDYNSQNKGINERHKIRAVLVNPTQGNVLAKALIGRGDYEAATAVIQPQIAQEISENKFEVGKDFKYKLNTKSGNFTIAIRRNPEDPTSFELIYPNANKEGEISVAKAPNRETLLGLLYKLVTINNAEFTLE